MPVTPGTLPNSNFTEILCALVNTRQTGYLKIREGDMEGFLAIEAGTIVHARTGPYTALHALFQFVGWAGARFEFHERPMPTGLYRDLAVYDPQVLISGVAAKVKELAATKAAQARSRLRATG